MWNIHSVLNVLYSLVEKSNINKQVHMYMYMYIMYIIICTALVYSHILYLCLYLRVHVHNVYISYNEIHKP